MIDVITSDQTKHKTNREKFLRLNGEFYKIIATAQATPQGFEELLIKFLARTENLRMQAELDVRRLEKEISLHEGTARACAQLSNLLVGLVEEHRKVLETRKATPAEIAPVEAKPAAPTVTDTELLQTICFCGCQDEEDAKDCPCSCHTNPSGLCDNPSCVGCRKREQENKPRRAPAKKKTIQKKKPKKKADK